MLGLVTIGQSPRVDVLADLLPLLEGRDWVEHGALDPYDAEGVAAFGPAPGEPPLVSRMRDGARVRLGHAAIVPLVERAIAECAADGARAVLLMCSGHMPPLRSSVPVHLAESLAQTAIAREIGPDRLGVVLPVADQVDEAAARWTALLGTRPAAAAADPYTAPLDEIVDAGRRVAAAGADRIVLDCFGYGQEAADAIAAATGVPTEAVRMIAAQAALELAAA